MLGPVAAICLVPFVWCYVLPKLGPAAWKGFIWVCTLVGFSAALAIIYLAIIAAFNYLGTGVDVTLKSLADSLGEVSHNLPTPQGLVALTIVLVVFVILLWCLPLICGQLSALTKTCAGVPSIRTAPASPTSNDSSEYSELIVLGWISIWVGDVAICIEYPFGDVELLS